MRILALATKSPWPPNDGGRLALDLCLDQLHRAGHEICLVAPCEPERLNERRAAIPGAMKDVRLLPLSPRAWPGALLASLADGASVSIARHRHGAMQAAVTDALANLRPDMIHVEQLQAMANLPRARPGQPPLVLRMQNVESALWRQAPWPARWLASGVRADGRIAMRRAERIVCLTQRDAQALGDIADPAHRGRVTAVPPGFPAILPAGPEQSGAPALALSGSSGWRPNAAGAAWFMQEVWPRVAQALPRARIHLFGCAGGWHGTGIQGHAAPVDSQQAFPVNGLCMVPLQSGSGIRMRILEAWARGLDVVSGRELLIADSAEQFVAAITRLTHEAECRAALIAAGRAYLRARHDPAAATAGLESVYRQAIATHARRNGEAEP